MSEGAFVSQPSVVADSKEMVCAGSDGSCLPAAPGRRSSTAFCRVELNFCIFVILYKKQFSFLVAEHFQSASASFGLSCSRRSWVQRGSGFIASGVNGMEEDAAANGSTTSAGVLLKP